MKRKKCFVLVSLLLPFFIVLLTGFAKNRANASDITISNPTVSWLRYFTTNGTFPAVSQSSASGTPPINLISSDSTYLLHAEVIYDVTDGTFNQYTTVSGQVHFQTAHASDGGSWSICNVGIRLTNNELINTSCTIYDNTLTASGGDITYTFSTQIPENTAILRVNVAIGNLPCADAYACSPLAYGLTRLTSYSLRIVSENSAGTEAIISEINSVNEKLDTLNDTAEDINDSVNEINDYLQDDSDPELSQDSLDAIADSAGWLPAGPVDSILTLPITFIQGIVNVLTGSDRCQALNLPLPFLNNQFIQLPCMRPILNQMGFLSIYEVVGGIISMFILWNTLKWLYEFIDKTLTFREDNSGLWGGL